MRIGRCCLNSILHGPRALAVTHSGTYWMAGLMTSQAPKVSKRQTVINIRIAEDTDGRGVSTSGDGDKQGIKPGTEAKVFIQLGRRENKMGQLAV